MEPTIPALHCSITSFGLLTMNSGEPMIGRESLERTGGSDKELSDDEGVQNDSRASAFTLSPPSRMASRAAGALLSRWSA